MDLKFEHCREFPQSYRTVASEIASPEILPLAEFFLDNIKRIDSLAQLPAEVNYWSTIFGACRAEAHTKYRTEEVTDEVADYSNARLRAWLDRREAALGTDVRVLAEHQWDVGSGNFKSLMTGDTSGEFAQGTEALLAAMITSAWAALETLSIDLWVVALNKHPDTLGIRAAESCREKSVSLNELAGMNFDLRSRMGDFLYKSKKVNLETFNAIRNAYQCAFGVDWIGIFDRHSHLKFAEIVRHLFAHRSGRIDRAFLSRAADIPDFASSSPGEMLRLDGLLVAKCVGACVSTGVDLLHFVDTWSQPNARSIKKP